MKSKFTIKLLSDGEPGTGLGGEVVNAFIPRNFRGLPVVHSSHVKGLMRASLQDVCDSLSWGNELVEQVFGVSDDQEPGRVSTLRVHDAEVSQAVAKKLVTRTAIDSDSGVAKDASLRTSEAIPIGTEFVGNIESHADLHSVEDIAWRLSLLSIRAFGGSRNRGCGLCLVSVDGEKRSAGELLRELAKKIAGTGGYRPSNAVAVKAVTKSIELSAKTVVVRLVFRATMPVCCPEITDKTNVIKTGFSIPASAVQGAILTRLNLRNPELATALYAHPTFRAWPMQPCHLPLQPNEALPTDLPTPIRVSLTHRMAKFSAPGEDFAANHFFDKSIDIEPYDWKTNPAGAPLKASDGVLLRAMDGTCRLWKAGSMPHVVTTHGVHSDPETVNGRNLYTVDAMAPLIWQGLVAMPENAAQQLIASLKDDPDATFGKGRSVRGLGELSASIMDGVPREWQRNHNTLSKTVLVVQSPLLLSDTRAVSAEDELKTLAGQWAQQHKLPAPSEAWANVGILFGWNRHDSGASKRLRASRVALPGSVIVFTEPVDSQNLQAGLIAGLGLGGRERGFGAVSVHPGKAVGVYSDDRSRSTPAPPKDSRSFLLRDAIKIVLQMQSTNERLPTASQIRAVQQIVLKNGSEAARNYLTKQTERPGRIWFTWEPILKQVDQLLSAPFDPSTTAKALEVLADLQFEQAGKHE